MTRTSIETMYDKDYLGFDDLLDPEGKPLSATVEIEAVVGARLKRPGTGDDDPGKKSPIITLKGKRKKFVVGKTNKETIKAMYGRFIEDWIGKRITLYADPKVRAFGKVVGGVRVRPGIPKEGATSAPLDAPANEERKAARDEAFGRGEGKEEDRGNDPDAY